MQIISAGVFTVCGCYSSAGSACATAIATTVGAVNTGVLESGDCIDGPRGRNYYTDKYSFDAVAGQQVSISLTSSAFDSYVYLKNSNGDVVTDNDDSGGSTNSRIPQNSGYYTLSAGTYTVEVTSFSMFATGAYSLLISAPTSTSSMISSSSRPPCLNRSVVSGVTTNGTLTSNSCRLGSRGGSKYTDNYAFSGAPGQNVSILLTSFMFDTYLSLKNPDGTVISSDDDGSGDGSSNSRIPATSGVYTIPAGATGTYVIEVSSYSNFATGDYSLLFTRQ